MLELGLIWDHSEDNQLSVRPISYESTKPFILNIHYARRMPSISHSFGLYEGSQLIGVITYGMPSSNNLCEGICGKENRKNVIELNRLCLSHNRPNEASMLVGRSLQMLPKPMIVVSYADSGQKHVGIVYQATNFLFTGTTKLRTDPLGESNKHARHTACAGAGRTIRFPKHRYVYFVGNKTERKRLRKQLLYPVIPYIKNDSNSISLQD